MLVNIKFVGEYAAVNLLCSKGNPKPTLNGFGITSSVVSAGLPAPNCNCRVVEFKNLVANLFCTCFVCNKKGASVSKEVLGEFTLVFLKLSYINS